MDANAWASCTRCAPSTSPATTAPQLGSTGVVLSFDLIRREDDTIYAVVTVEYTKDIIHT
jgi:hypothetical protein